jgi:hypothetical protein
MAYTDTDLAAVQAAKLELALGKRVVRLTVAGKSFEFAQAQMADLERLGAEIQNELAQTAGTPGYILTSTSKGL